MLFGSGLIVLYAVCCIVTVSKKCFFVFVLLFSFTALSQLLVL